MVTIRWQPRLPGWFLMGGLLILAACSGPAITDPTQVPPPPAGSTAPPVSTESAAPAGTATRTTGVADSTPTELPEPTEPPEPADEPAEQPAPTPRAGLDASNPRNITLASGGLQFVEFFAFW